MTAEQQREQKTRRETRPKAMPDTLPIAMLIIALLGIVAVSTWVVHLEATLPDIRSPRDPGTSEVLEGHAMMLPGYHNISVVDVSVDGDWLVQEIGESDWLATDEGGSSLRAAFYGTELYLLARAGPDAGRAYVTVNDRPVEHLAEDEIGSYVDLWGNQAADIPILLATGLAHGEHAVEITSAGEGEVAVSGFDVIAETPFPWAFVLGYIGLGGGLFIVIRALLNALDRQGSELVRGSRPHTTDSNTL